jgi:ankyrin repeat protein
MRTIAAFFLATASLWAAPTGTVAYLADAAEHGDRAAVRELIAQGSAVNAAQVDGMTALHWAAYNDDLETAQLLIEAKANVETTNRYGVSALSLAATNGNAALIQTLLDAGADANTTRHGGETVLLTAARTGKVDAVRVLLAHGADPNQAESEEGQTALMWAAAEGHAEAVQELLRGGADLTARLPSGFTALFFAVRNGRMDAARTLLEVGADVNQEIEPTGRVRGGPRPGSTPLLLAAGNGHFELAAMLLDAGADPNAAETGYNVLHKLAEVNKAPGGDYDPAPQGSGEMGLMEFVEYIVKKGADLNARVTEKVRIGGVRLNPLGATPFLLAAQQADAEYMRKLADLGADPSITNEDNSTALMVAAGIGTRSPGEDAGTGEEVVEAMQVALDLGADINAVDNNGETAMHGAAYKNAPLAVEWLDEKGADINVWHNTNSAGWTPLIIARGYRWGNFKPSATTIEALSQVMLARGVTPTFEPAKSGEIY